jgi:hypothetical protein
MIGLVPNSCERRFRETGLVGPKGCRHKQEPDQLHREEQLHRSLYWYLCLEFVRRCSKSQSQTVLIVERETPRPTASGRRFEFHSNV